MAATARVVLLADGEVGARVARLLLARAPCPVVGIVLAAAAGEAAGVAATLAPSLPARVHDGTERAALAGWIRALEPDLLLLAWWPFILRDELSCGQHATLNLHPSLLPHGRGKDPNFWALVEQAPFGVSIHHVTPGIDEGPVAFQQALPCDWTDTGGTLHRRAQDALVHLVGERLEDMLALRIPRIAQQQQQEPAPGRTHRRAELDPRSTIALDAPTTARALLDLLRARTFPPHPACRFEAAGQTYEVRIAISRVDRASS